MLSDSTSWLCFCLCFITPLVYMTGLRCREAATPHSRARVQGVGKSTLRPTGKGDVSYPGRGGVVFFYLFLKC